MSMLFVGSQKHSALSIFAKTTRMSALVLCGNSGVILLSVTDHQHIDSAIPGRYTVQAPYKAGVGIGVLEWHTATIGALASFLLLQLSYTQIMVGWVGAPKGAPVSVCAGYANPAQFTTSEIGVSGGGYQDHESEAAYMLATTPTQNPQFIWIIAAVRRDMPTITAKIHHIAAETEQEARRILARDHVCFFAGRIRTGGAHA